MAKPELKISKWVKTKDGRLIKKLSMGGMTIAAAHIEKYKGLAWNKNTKNFDLADGWRWNVWRCGSHWSLNFTTKIHSAKVRCHRHLVKFTAEIEDGHQRVIKWNEEGTG